MRQAFNDKNWLHNENGDLLGVCLGYDHCAEHEEGIADLLVRFGIPSGTPQGIEDRTIRTGGDQLIFLKRRATKTVKGKRYAIPVAILATVPRWKSPEQAEQDYLKMRSFGLYIGTRETDLAPSRNEIQTAWGRDGFSIAAIGKAAVENLDVLASAFQQLDGCISLAGASNPFARNGLCLTIASRISSQVRESVLAADQAYIRLHAAADATGLKEALKAAGVRVYALEPRWAGPDETQLKFFLNPGQRDQYNCGWFTEGELRACLAGTGPVLRQPTAS